MAPMVLTEDQIKMVVKEAVVETLKSLGVDTKEPFDMQRDFAFLRATREASDAVKRTGLLAAVGAIVLGLLGLVWAKVTGSI